MSFNTQMTAGEIMEAYVYPYLDAVEVGLLDDLYPGTAGSRNTYNLDCPKCKEKKRAYYWPTGAIVCNRIENCAYTGNIWSYLAEYKHLSNKECFDTLCRAVKFDPRTIKSDEPRKKPIGPIFQKVLRNFAAQYPEHIKEFAVERRFTDEQMSQLNYGYYPSDTEVRTALIKAGATILDAADAGYVPYDDKTKKNNSVFMAGRVIGFWKERDGKLGYWGYCLKRNRSENKKSLLSKKYLFSSGGSKDLPYSFRPLNLKASIFVEGMLDSDSLSLLGFASACTGFNKITESQADALAHKSIQQCTFLTDGDYAGFTGAVSTVFNCSKQNIRCNIILTPTTLDDADSLRADKAYDVIKALMSSDYKPGVFLAFAWIYSANHADGDKHNIKELIDAKIGSSPSWIRVPFYKELASHGYDDVEDVENAQYLSNLILKRRKVIILSTDKEEL